MAAADAPSTKSSPADPSIESISAAGHANGEGSFAQGMYVSIWPKIERCHNYVAVLLAAQEQLQETVDQLIAGTVPVAQIYLSMGNSLMVAPLNNEGLREAEQAESSSLVGYADRLKHFPGRVERLQHKLEIIEDRLIELRESRARATGRSVEPNNLSPLF